jgi:hypothetical protein
VNYNVYAQHRVHRTTTEQGTYLREDEDLPVFLLVLFQQFQEDDDLPSVQVDFFVLEEFAY